MSARTRSPIRVDVLISARMHGWVRANALVSARRHWRIRADALAHPNGRNGASMRTHFFTVSAEDKNPFTGKNASAG
jgi:hypothetical protein